jgi:hypothetical protein
MARLAAFAAIVLLLTGIHLILLRFPLAASVASVGFKYLSIAYVSGRLLEWFYRSVSSNYLQMVARLQRQESSL